MFVAENEGFIESGSDERALVAKMRAGATMNVKAVSARGTNVNYAFSLKGITAALRKTKAICG
jgi:invasion protein IalB